MSSSPVRYPQYLRAVLRAVGTRYPAESIDVIELSQGLYFLDSPDTLKIVVDSNQRLVEDAFGMEVPANFQGRIRAELGADGEGMTALGGRLRRLRRVLRAPTASARA